MEWKLNLGAPYLNGHVLLRCLKTENKRQNCYCVILVKKKEKINVFSNKQAIRYQQESYSKKQRNDAVINKHVIKYHHQTNKGRSKD